MKIAYLTYEKAPHLKDTEQPDVMIAEQKILEDADKDLKDPWITVSIKDYGKVISDIQANSDVIFWQDKQPRLVEVSEGIREPRDSHLKPFPKLQPIVEQK